MGRQDISAENDKGGLRTFVRHLLRDLHALEQLLETGAVESDRRRIGAEQEFFLIDANCRPAPVGAEVLARCSGLDVTPELARFNVELNVAPLDFGGDCLSRLEKALGSGCRRIAAEAEAVGARTVLAGILPTLVVSDLDVANMADSPRYRSLDEIVRKMRGGDYVFRIKGTDELIIRHDSVMIEACNTSLQVHLQVDPARFAETYNLTQLFAAPTLAVATNSPILFGRRLWRETRLALFQQSMDTRQASSCYRETSARVIFGTDWVRGSIIDIYKEDIARFRALIGIDECEDPFEAMEQGRAPRLDALRLHNGTVYRWNRPCYGISDGKAHVRIENRLLPSGPSVIDEVANSALWLGLVQHGLDEGLDASRVLEFDDARENLLAAARHGLGAHFTWVGGEQVPAKDLVLGQLLEGAEAGLVSAGVDADDAARYLGVIRERVTSGLTGSQWMLSSLAAMKGKGTKTERLAALTSAMVQRQKEGRPVHEWSLADFEESGGWKRHYQRVEQFMSTDLFTVNQDEAVDLVACLMDWRHIRHVPVEDDSHRLVGLVTHRLILRLVSRNWATSGKGEPVPVRDIMETDLITARPETTTLEAIRLMKVHGVACLPVVKDGVLVGVVSERDLITIAAPLLEKELEG